MFTAIYSLDKVIGARELIVFIIVCWIICLGISQLFKANRSRSGRIRMAACMFGASIICDIAWWICMYSGGEYVNQGIGSVWVVIVSMPLAMIAALLAALVINGRKQQS